MEVFAQTLFNELARRKRVVLPGLGTFTVQVRPLKEDPGGKIPVPFAEVSFTSVEEEGETLPEIAERMSGIPLRDIQARYHRWAAPLRSDSRQGSFSIPEVVTV
ncbi:MAG: hypothetical protein LUD68_00780, partial [Rikenellaceae bacterium]|nr:hypothetical protein [Rikenellaceae bacterium]